ncbi:uncharacterized protein PtrM4_152640 [Pyrenophora tritici-repentis]|uniref:Uncharacterized protein n=1 Tax=Pyrenophora tritici-repentis TaxID=45151 RepID=A0A834RLL5_9PLEO|nr:hypothetical protein PtrM4_154050 [Pyrenophora tritici-repentis]KAF7564332.1 hypothetical protein PtrM4_152640 [Pyrenophora tritici-repentis]
MASQAAGNGAASNKQPTPVAADHGRKWCNPRRLGAASSCVALVGAQFKGPQSRTSGIYTAYAALSPPNGFQKANPTPKATTTSHLYDCPLAGNRCGGRPCRPSAEYKSEHSYPATSVNGPP